MPHPADRRSRCFPERGPLSGPPRRPTSGPGSASAGGAGVASGGALGRLAALGATLLIGGLIAGQLSGCSSGPSRAPARELELEQTAWRGEGFRWDWKAPATSIPESLIAHIVATPEYVAVVDDFGGVSVLSADTGRELWARRLRGGVTSYFEPMFLDESLVLTTPDQLFEVKAATGADVARINRLSRIAQTAPLIASEYAFYGTATGVLSMQHRQLGFEDHAVRLDGPINVRPVLVGENVVGAVSRGGDVLFVDVNTGARVVTPDLSLAGDEGTTAQLVADDRRMYVASLDQSVYAFDPSMGRRAWRFRTSTPLTANPAVAGDAVVITLPEYGLTALNRENGELLWNNEDVTGEVITTRAGELVVCGEGEVITVDPNRGDVIGRIPVPNAVAIIADQPEDGSIYILDEAEFIYKFTPAR